MNDDNASEPQENPGGTGHLPAAGEVGNGPVSYHDPVTQPTDDIEEPDDTRAEKTEQTDEPPTPGAGGIAGLS